MTTILQISDTHFGTEQQPVMRALQHLAQDQAPELIVLSGDITQRARRRQFRAAREFLDELNPPALLTIPGNHDIPLFNLAARLFAPYAGYMRAFGKTLEPEVETERFLVIGINTTRPRRHKNGELSRRQIERVAERLKTAHAQQLRIVVVHQPVLAIRDSDEKNLLRGHREAIPVWAAAGCDIIMGGHIHLPYIRSLRTTFAGLSRDMWTVQAGTALSSRIRDGIPNSVNLLRIDSAAAGRCCSVERWDYTAAAERFVQHKSEALVFHAPDAI